MVLNQFIKKFGIRQIAHECGVSTASVYCWINYRTCPLPHHMQTIKKLSNGELDYAGIIEPYLKNRTTRK